MPCGEYQWIQTVHRLVQETADTHRSDREKGERKRERQAVRRRLACVCFWGACSLHCRQTARAPGVCTVRVGVGWHVLVNKGEREEICTNCSEIGERDIDSHKKKEEKRGKSAHEHVPVLQRWVIDDSHHNAKEASRHEQDRWVRLASKRTIDSTWKGAIPGSGFSQCAQEVALKIWQPFLKHYLTLQ